MKTLVLCIMLLLTPVLLAQDTTTLAWDYTPEDTAYLQAEGGGFKIYGSKTSSGPYTLMATVADPTARQATFDTSTLRGRNYFVATAFIPQNESDWSNEVSWPFKPEKPTNVNRK